MSRVADFCPVCGHKTELALRNGRERPVCTECGHIVYFDPKVAVLAFVLQDEKLLLVKRAIDPGKGKWACPAGFVDYDEAPEDALRREVLEETGLEVTIDRLLEIFPKLDNGLADIIIAYQAFVAGGMLQANDDAEDVGWFAKDELPELVFHPSIALSKQWRTGSLR